MDGIRSHWERRGPRGWPSRARVSPIPSGVAPTVCRGDRGAPSRDAPTAHCSLDTLLALADADHSLPEDRAGVYTAVNAVSAEGKVQGE